MAAAHGDRSIMVNLSSILASITNANGGLYSYRASQVMIHCSFILVTTIIGNNNNKLVLYIHPAITILIQLPGGYTILNLSVA